MAEAPEYAAPALDKGLDILELLSAEPGALSQSEIADAVGRSVGQIFRVLATLERRGYLVRDKQSGLYTSSMKLFDLAHRHPPLRALIEVATPALRELAESTRQSCNLAVVDAGRVRVGAQVESPADFGYRVRVGAEFSLEATATGEAFTSGSTVVRPDALQPGITDVAVPVFDASGVIAALTVPYVATTFSSVPAADVVTAAERTAAAISRTLRGPGR
jgi:DNA-binding IclR family transcriptional regulator